MGVIFLLLKILGVLLLIILLLLLIVLLVPIRYRWQGKIDDPAAHSEIDPEALLRSASGQACVSWLLRLIQAQVAYPSGELLSVKIFGIRLPIEKLLGGKKAPEEKKEEEKPEEPKEKKPLTETLREIPDKVQGILDKVDAWLFLLTDPDTQSALEKVFTSLGAMLRHYLPREWHLNGVLGLGDPAASAGVLQVCGLLYPATDGRLQLDTDFLEYRFDIDTAGRGRIRLIHILTAAVRIILDGNVRGVITKVRKGV